MAKRTAQQEIDEKTQIGRFLEVAGEEAAESVGASSWDDVEVIVTDRGVVLEREDSSGITKSTTIPHKTIERIMKDTHLAAALSPETHLPTKFPVGTNVTTTFGPGHVHRVTKTSLGITLKTGGVLSFLRSEVLQGAVARTEE
jgi:hypothetical protein